MRHRLLFTAALVAATLTGSLAVATPAWALATPVTVSQMSAVNSDAGRTLTVPCPTGTKVLSGVATVDSPRAVALTGVLPDADLRNVIVIGQEMGIGEPGNWAVTAYTVCADDRFGLETDSAWQVPASPVSQFNTASCFDEGKTVLAAGYAIYSGKGEVVLRYLKPSGPTTASMAATEDVNGFGFAWHSMIVVVCASTG